MAPIKSYCVLIISLVTLFMLCACSTPAVKTQVITVKTPVYVALPRALTTPVPMPAFPVELTNAAWAQYTLDLQAALKVDIDKLDKIQALKPPGH